MGFRRGGTFIDCNAIQSTVQTSHFLKQNFFYGLEMSRTYLEVGKPSTIRWGWLPLMVHAVHLGWSAKDNHALLRQDLRSTETSLKALCMYCVHVSHFQVLQYDPTQSKFLLCPSVSVEGYHSA